MIQQLNRLSLSWNRGRRSSDLPSYTSPLSAGTTNLIVGNSLTDVGIIITYDAVRGALYQTGTIEISSPYSDLVNSPPVVNFDFDDIGLTFTADLSGNNIRLNCIVTAGVDVAFNYVVEVIKGSKTINPIPNGSTSDLILTILSGTSVKLDWTNGSTDEDGISIERGLDGLAFTEITTVGAGISTYTDTGLTEGTLYYYRVRAFRN